jgi:energy-converting hydrogenase Eha subunit C
MDDLFNTLVHSGLLWFFMGIVGGFLGLVFSYREIGKIIRILRTQSGMIGSVNQISADEYFETTGKAGSETTLQSPITRTPCILWEVTVKEKRGSGKHSRWVTVLHKTSEEPFYLSDGTGKFPIDPRQPMELILREDVKKSSGMFSALDEQAEAALIGLGVDTTGFLNFNRNLRIHERFIERDDDIYVFGKKTYGEPDLDSPLIVSDHSERQLLGRFFWLVAGKIFLGVILGVFLSSVFTNP